MESNNSTIHYMYLVYENVIPIIVIDSEIDITYHYIHYVMLYNLKLI